MCGRRFPSAVAAAKESCGFKRVTHRAMQFVNLTQSRQHILRSPDIFILKLFWPTRSTMVYAGQWISTFQTFSNRPCIGKKTVALDTAQPGLMPSHVPNSQVRCSVTYVQAPQLNSIFGFGIVYFAACIRTVPKLYNRYCLKCLPVLPLQIDVLCRRLLRILSWMSAQCLTINEKM